MPNFNPKKAIIILGIIFLVTAVIMIVYRANKKTTPDTGVGPIIGVTDPTSGSLPQAEPGSPGTSTPTDGQLTPNELKPTTDPAADSSSVTRDNKIQDLVEYTSASPTLSSDGTGVQYYDQADNKFYRISDSGQPIALSNKEFFNVKKVSWSPDKNKAILEYPDDSKIIYDFNTEKQISLPSHWHDFQFSPGGQSIAFKSLGQDPNNSWLAVVNNDGTEARTIEKIGTNADNVIVSWSPNNQTIAMYTEGQNFDQKSLYFVGLNQENFKSMIINGRGFLPLWSTSGGRLLYSVYSSDNDLKPVLWTAEAQGEAIGANLTPLNLTTWADKCVFASDSEAYCAVPRYLPSGAGLLPSTSVKQNDDLYLINLLNGQKTLIDDSGLYSMSKLILTSDQKTLYFTDQKTGRLYKLAL